MAIAKGLRRLGGIGFDETAVRVRQVHAKIMEPDLLARDIAVRLAEIRLGVARTMAQRHEHLAGPLHCLRHILAHDRVAAGKSFFVPQPVENPMRGVALLFMNARSSSRTLSIHAMYGPSFFETGRSRRR